MYSMTMSSQKTAADGRTEKHPSVSTNTRYPTSNRITPHPVKGLTDGTADTDKVASHNYDGRGNKHQRLNRTDICMAVLFLMSAGSLIGIVWNVAHTGKSIEADQSVEKLIKIGTEIELNRQLDAISKRIFDTISEERVVKTVSRIPGLANGATHAKTGRKTVSSRSTYPLNPNPVTQKTRSTWTLKSRVSVLETLESTSISLPSTANKVPALTHGPTILPMPTTLNPARTSIVTFPKPREKTPLTSPSPYTDDITTDFVVAILPAADPLYSYQLNILSNDNGTVVLTGHGIDLDQTIYGVKQSGLVIALPHEAVHFETGIKFKSLSISSDVDVTVIGQVANSRGHLRDTFNAVPTKLLSTEYVVVSYQPVTDQKSQFLVLSTRNDTRVEIHLRYFDGIKHIDAGRREVKLDKSESYQYRHDHDLTGTVIRSNYRIAVYAGTSEAYVEDRRSVSTLQDQLLPTAMWSNHYVMPGMKEVSAGASKGYVARIIAKEEGTNVTVYTKSNLQHILLNKSGDYCDVDGHESMSISSNRAVTTTKFAFGRIHSNPSYTWYPYMSIIPPIERYWSSCTLYCTLYIRKFCYVNVIAKSSAVSKLLLDNAPFQPIDLAIAPPPFDRLWTMRVRVSAGAHQLNSTDSTTTFGAIIYNDEPNSRFGHPCGFK